jgi:hypothetical protein
MAAGIEDNHPLRGRMADRTLPQQYGPRSSEEVRATLLTAALRSVRAARAAPRPRAKALPTR